ATTIGPNTCSIDDYKPYCCQSMSGPAGSPGLLNLIPVDLSASLGCVVGVIGSQCGASVKCCKDDVTNTGNSFLIINAANCVA
nr:Chain A, Hydrophobin [Neurospora crassa]